MLSSSSWSPSSLARVPSGLLAAPVVGALFLVSLACGPSTPSDQDVLVSLTGQVIVPAYQAAAKEIAQMDREAAALCDAPGSESLEAARQSWHTARASWMQSEAMWFGPVMERRSVSLLDWPSTDTAGIDEMLAAGTLVETGQLRDAFSAKRRGFGAIEYLLFREDALGVLNASPAYCSYLTALTEVAKGEADAILSEWTDGTDQQAPYQDYFTGTSNLALLPGAAVEEVVRTQVFMVRDIVQMRLASALGLRESGADLSVIPGNAADNGLEDLRNEILGMQAIYEGAGPEALGISDLVRPLSEDTAQRTSDQLAAALAATDSVDGTLRNAIADRPEQVKVLYDRLQELQRTLATEVVSLLGVSVGFSDTDGDTMR